MITLWSIRRSDQIVVVSDPLDPLRQSLSTSHKSLPIHWSDDLRLHTPVGLFRQILWSHLTELLIPMITLWSLRRSDQIIVVSDPLDPLRQSLSTSHKSLLIHWSDDPRLHTPFGLFRRILWSYLTELLIPNDHFVIHTTKWSNSCRLGSFGPSSAIFVDFSQTYTSIDPTILDSIRPLVFSVRSSDPTWPN